jgi:hypothetical protein
MDSILLKARHWQIFLLFTVGYLTSTSFEADVFTVGCVFLLLLVLYVGYYAILGNRLFPYLSRKAYYSITWFLIDAFFIIGVHATAIIVFDGNLRLDGFAAIPGLYLFFAIGHLF